jgi:hypothetical protein
VVEKNSQSKKVGFRDLFSLGGEDPFAVERTLEPSEEEEEIVDETETEDKGEKVEESSKPNEIEKPETPITDEITLAIEEKKKTKDSKPIKRVWAVMKRFDMSNFSELVPEMALKVQLSNSRILMSISFKFYFIERLDLFFSFSFLFHFFFSSLH